ncbi:MAG: T9SS type A sorting domain-containing protein [Bacteroidota bacterium]
MTLFNFTQAHKKQVACSNKTQSISLLFVFLFCFAGNVFSSNTKTLAADTTPPVAIAQDVTVTLSSSGTGSTTAEAVDNGSSDESGIASITLSQTDFNCSNVGANPVTLTVTDVHGNVSTADAIVTVVDITRPTVVTRNGLVVLNAGGTGSITASAVTLIASDACGIASSTLSKSTFDCSNIGENVVSLTVTDVNGNTTIVNATIMVRDRTAPVAIAQDATVTLVNGTAYVTAAQIDNGSHDACGIATIMVSPNTFTCANIGDNEVTLTVTDASGNIGTTTATVTVLGSFPTCSLTATPSGTIIGGPVTYDVPNQLFLGYGYQSMTLSSTVTGDGPFTYSWSGSGLSSTNTATTEFTPTTGGYYTFSLTVRNSNGCESTCTITICVIDVRDPAQNPDSTKKVLICHVPKGNPLNRRTIRVSINAAKAHISLHGGDKLGSCDAICGMAKGSGIGEIFSEETTLGEVNLLVYPNPSSKEFNFKLETESAETVNFKVYDMSGALVLEKTALDPKELIVLNTITNSGIYMAEVTQGEFHKLVRITKMD